MQAVLTCQKCEHRYLVLCASVIYIKQLNVLLKTVVSVAETLPTLLCCNSVNYRELILLYLGVNAECTSWC